MSFVWQFGNLNCRLYRAVVILSYFLHDFLSGFKEFVGQDYDYDSADHIAGSKYGSQDNLKAVGLLREAVAAKSHCAIWQECVQLSLTVLEACDVVLGFDECSLTKCLHQSVVAITVSKSCISCPETVESVELRFGNRLDFLQDEPVDSLRTGWRGEGTWVVVEVSKVHLTQQVSQI